IVYMQQPEISIHPLIGRLRLKKVVRSVVKDYYKELNRRKNKEISFSELPDVLVDKMAVWDDYETDYTIFSVCGIDIRVLDDELAEALKKLPERNDPMSRKSTN
ncbi:hypothetical protein LI205_32795, partial [bacterium MSK18_59]|nr:hypothetical protein [bacterium MSK18_59]